MARFEDQPVAGNIGKQDLGYRSDEVRGPYREAWAEKPVGAAEDRTDSPGGGSGLGDNQNPAWAGAQASLESDTAGRGSYGSGEEGASGYGKHQDAAGEMPSSPTRDMFVAPAPTRDASPSETQSTGAQSTVTQSASSTSTATSDLAAPADEGFGTRHWGHGEFKGEDGASETPKAEGSVLERAAETVGKFFGVGPKGYAPSNDRVHEDVCEVLRAHDEVNAAEVEVKVTEGKVALTGTVDDRQMRRTIEELIAKVAGVREVENHLGLTTYVARTEEADRLKSGEAEVPPSLHS